MLINGVIEVEIKYEINFKIFSVNSQRYRGCLVDQILTKIQNSNDKL